MIQVQKQDRSIIRGHRTERMLYTDPSAQLRILRHVAYWLVKYGVIQNSPWFSSHQSISVVGSRKWPMR